MGALGLGAGGVARVSELAKLPPFTSVLTATNGSLALPPEQQRELAVIVQGNKSVLLLSAQEKSGSQSFLALCQRIREQKLELAGTRPVTHALLSTIYERSSRNAKEDSGKLAVARSSNEIRDFENILKAAILEGASDIHFLSTDKACNIRFRVDGKLVVFAGDYPMSGMESMLRAVFNTVADNESKTSALDLKLPQSCSIERSVNDGVVKIRYQHAPVYPRGYNAVCRVIPIAAKAQERSFADAGYAPGQIVLLQQALRQPDGMIVFAGETGSGKSSSLVVCLQDMIRHSHGADKFCTVENPPEYIIEGAEQIPVGRRPGDMAETMKAVLRMDPDTVMIGEVRNGEEVGIAKDMVLSGHKVLTTVHAGGAIKVFKRLHEIGVTSETLFSTNFVAASVYQRLVPLLCPSCKKPLTEVVDQDYLSRVAGHFNLAEVFANGGGCPSCKGRGIKGRTVAAEVLIPRPDVLACLRTGDEDGAGRAWRERHLQVQLGSDVGDGMTAIEHALIKVVAGLVDPRDVEEEFGPFEKSLEFRQGI